MPNFYRKLSCPVVSQKALDRPSESRRISILPILGLLVCVPAMPVFSAPSSVTIYPIPREVRSNHYSVSINGRRTAVIQATSNYYVLNYDEGGPVTVSVTASDPHFWDKGVEIQPMRLGIRPVRHGATITFPLSGPEKLTVMRPGDHFANGDILFLFGNEPDTSRIGPTTPGVRYYGPGIHHEAIDAHSGDTIYLAGGAVVFGSLNLWQVHDVRILGRGMVIYDGPQDPYSDTGWMHKRNWHAIVMDNARNIEIDGITTVVRSRTWQVQMRDSRHIGFYNFKTIAGTKGNANQDGIDWLGGGDTTIRNSFFRASDDVFAMYGNWDGYSEEAMHSRGHEVSNVTIEHTIATTSISNTVRVNWPQKSFDSAHFYMHDMDVLHTGFSSCKVPFAFFELWADPSGSGQHRDYRMEDIRLEDWYSLFQIRQPNPLVSGVHFSGIWAMDGPGMLPSAVKGQVQNVTLQDVPDIEGQPLQVLNGAAAPQLLPAIVDANFTYSPGALAPMQNITLTAAMHDTGGRSFHWLFGDGTQATGRVVRHHFPDAEGTLLDGSGRFRVLLHVIDRDGRQSWRSQSIVVGVHPMPASLIAASATIGSDVAGNGSRYEAGHTVRRIHIPADGGYTFTLLASSPGTFTIDDMAPVASPAPRPGVCGSKENATQPTQVSAVLRAGWHTLFLQMRDRGEPRLLWEGPGIPRQALPMDRF